MLIYILSEAAQEQNNKHIHPKWNSRHDTHYNDIAVTSLATIQPKGIQTRTPSRACHIHQIFYYNPWATQTRRGSQISPMYKFCDQSIAWENRGVNIPLLIINKDKIRKKLIQARYVENFKWLTTFLLFDMHNPFSCITCMYVTSF